MTILRVTVVVSVSRTSITSQAPTLLSSILDTVCAARIVDRCPSWIGTTTLEGLADEIRCHLSGFLLYNEFIRCASHRFPSF
jgi:hypothetical protein